MNDGDRVEEALRGLCPAPLDASLMATLSAARPRARTARQRVRWGEEVKRWLAPLAASACVAVITFSWLEGPPANPITARSNAHADRLSAIPVESQNYLVSAKPIGIFVAPDQKPYQMIDVEWLEHEAVRVSEEGPAIHTATTRRRVLPVALEIY